jgi:signal transduction histidine kinase/YHS domain-containing protein
MNHLAEICFFGMILLLTSNIWLIVRVLRPLQRLSAQAANLAQGNFVSLEQPCGGVPEIDALRRSMVGMVGHVRRAQEQSHTYADILTNGQESERARISHELHDDTIQSLVAISQSIDIARNWLQSDPTRAADLLQSARQQAVDTVTALRNLIADLRPPALEELGLVAALKMQAGKIDDLSVVVEVEGVERRLDETHELTLFRCAQEALANAKRHGHATQVTLGVAYRPDGIHLSVSDNGHGFKLPNALDGFAADGHYGLLGIKERVQHLQGMVHVTSDAGRGTTLAVCIPEDATHQPPHTVRDPVCSACLEPQQAYGSTEYNRQRYYFCCPVCQGSFQCDPELYLQPQNPSTVADAHSRCPH